MIENKLRDNKFYPTLSRLAEGLGLSILGISSFKKGSSEVHFIITIINNAGVTSINDCEKFHRSAMPYLEAEVGRDLLSMEVETPGIQHVIKDVSEFLVLKNYKIRVYLDKFSSWVNGTLSDAGDKGITLSSYTVEDTSETGEVISLSYEEIHKAKIL